MKKYIVLILLMAAATMAACGSISPASSGPKITVKDPWSRPSPLVGGNGVVYMELINQGGSDDILLGAETNIAEVAELHETKMEGDVMKMSPVPNIKIPAGGSVSLKPGGLHIMLIKLKQELISGQKITLTLNFEKSGPMTITAEVRDVEAMGQGRLAA